MSLIKLHSRVSEHLSVTLQLVQTSLILQFVSLKKNFGVTSHICWSMEKKHLYSLKMIKVAHQDYLKFSQAVLHMNTYEHVYWSCKASIIRNAFLNQGQRL